MKNKQTKILVPVDFSSGAANALKYAKGFAAKHNAKLFIVHVIHEINAFHTLPENVKANPFDEIQKRTMLMLKTWSSKILKNSKVPVNYTCQYGDVQELLLANINKIKPQLIIMGTEGADKTRKNKFGSNSLFLIDNSKFPVLTIPEKYTWKIPKKITLATDYEYADYKAFRTITSLFSPMNTEITLLHVADMELAKEVEKMDMENTMIKILRKTGHKKLKGSVVYNRNIEDGIKKFVKKNETEMLILTHIEKNWIEKILGMGVSGHILAYTNIPLMVFHSDFTDKIV